MQSLVFGLLFFGGLLALAYLVRISRPGYQSRRGRRRALARSRARTQELIAQGGVIVMPAGVLDAEQMAWMIQDLEDAGYAVMPTGPDSLYARPPERVEDSNWTLDMLEERDRIQAR